MDGHLILLRFVSSQKENTVNIGFIIEHLDPRRGGAETYIAQLSAELLRRGHTVHAFVQSASQGLPEGLQVHTIAVAGLGKGPRLLSFDKQSAAVAKRYDLDVAMAVGKTHFMNVFQPHGGTYRATLKQTAASRHAGVVRRALSALSPRRMIYLYMERRQYRHPERCVYVAISEMVKADMMRYYRVPEDRIALVYNGVDTERFSPNRRSLVRDDVRRTLSVTHDQVMLLMVAHNFRLKGVQQAIAALSRVGRLHRNRFRLVVVGKGRRRPYVGLAHELGLSDQVRFTGAVTHVEDYYAAADAYVQPTFYDPCSLVVLEALASGLPTITTRYNGASELMEHGREGYILDHPDHVDTLAEHFEQLLDGDLRHRMGEAARAVAERHSLSRNYEEMIAVFERAGG